MERPSRGKGTIAWIGEAFALT